ELVVRNFGNGPALKVMAAPIIIAIDSSSSLDKEVQSSCNLIFPFVGLKPTQQVSSFENISQQHWRQVIFPGQSLTVASEDGNNFTNALGKGAYVVGCIVYEDQFSDAHWTKFCYNTGDFANDAAKDASAFGRLHICNS